MKKLALALALALTPSFALAQSMPSWKSYMATGNTADIVPSAGTSNSVAAWLAKKVDVTSGSSTNQTLTTPTITGGTITNSAITGGTTSGQTLTSPTLSGGNETVTSTDKPGSAGTSIPNTLWVDEYYQPKSTFISSDTTWTVCSSGCDYTSPLDAWDAALSSNFLDNVTLTISISDGTYNLTNQFYTGTPNTRHVQVIGDTADNSKVILNFTNGKGTNLGGFSAYNGGAIGLIDGVTIQQPTDGTGALSSIDSSGRSIWNSQSYGAGIQAYGAGSNIQLGSHVTINWFYYSVIADNNGGIDAPSGGVTGEHAGDVNFMARGGGVIVCTPCTAIGASDYTDPTGTTLGSNFDAERNGTLYIDGSTGKWGMINGVVGITGGAIWAHNVTLTGGLNSGGSAITLWEGATGEFSGCSVSGGYSIGVTATAPSYADLTNCTIKSNSYGVVADGGRITGSNVTITDNTIYGIQALHQGSVVMYSTYAKMSGNGTNFSVQAAGTESTSGTAYTASSIDVQ